MTGKKRVGVRPAPSSPAEGKESVLIFTAKHGPGRPKKGLVPAAAASPGSKRGLRRPKKVPAPADSEGEGSNPGEAGEGEKENVVTPKKNDKGEKAETLMKKEEKVATPRKKKGEKPVTPKKKEKGGKAAAEKEEEEMAASPEKKEKGEKAVIQKKKKEKGEKDKGEMATSPEKNEKGEKAAIPAEKEKGDKSANLKKKGDMTVVGERRDLKDPQRHIYIQLTDDEVTEAVKKMLNEPIDACSKTGLSPFYAANKPPKADDPFWKRKSQHKPIKNPRIKIKASKKTAKRKNVEPSEPIIEDDPDSEVELDSLSSLYIHLIDNDHSQDEAEANHADEGTSHSSSGESSATQLPPLKTVPGAKARPSKKAKLNKPTDREPATEPEKTPEAIDPEAGTVTDNPEPQATDTLVELVENNPPSQSADPLSPTVDPPSPAKEPDKPPSPAKTTDDDVVVTGLGFSSPGRPVALSKHSAKEISAMDKGKWKSKLSNYSNLSAQELHSGFLNRLYTNRDFEAGLIGLMKERYEAELSKKDSQITDLQGNIKSQVDETCKVKSELTTALTTMERLKEFFKGEWADWATEKTTLLKRAEDAKNALKPATEELSSLKRQIDAMTSAIFGSCVTHLGTDMRKRLKAVYTLAE
nr:neurofilament heavy polypeptide-like [Aegilops tauschii subsp. strangulata]